MFIVWIITNLKNKEKRKKAGEKVRANTILAKVDESFFDSRNFKIKSFLLFFVL